MRRIGLEDLVLMIGLAMIFIGLYWIDWRWALVVLGGILAGLAVLVASRRS